MAPYIYGQKDKVHIFDLVKTKEGLKAACKYVADLPAGRQVLFVGTKRQAAGIVKRAATDCGMPYLTERWPGGMLTNFAQLTKSVRRLAELKAKREAGELKKYTKKEQLLIDREISKLERTFGGVANMDKKPDALFVVDTHHEAVAVKEAVKMGIPVVGLVDTNADPRLVDYVIPANDDAVKSIELIVEAISSSIASAKPPPSSKVTKSTKSKKTKKDEDKD